MAGKKPQVVDGIKCYCLQVDDNHRDYPATGLDNLYRSERHYFWLVSRCEYIVEIFKKYVGKHENIIEIGAGTGNVTRNLRAAGYKPAVGELHLSGLYYARSYGIKECYQFDLYDPPFQKHFDVIGMFDVLEHLDSSVEALKQVNSMLRVNGKLIITVPAHMWLWSRDDKIAEHKIRYTKSTMKDALKASGFEIVEMKYFFIFIVPLLWLRKILHSDLNSEVSAVEKKTDITINPILNKILLGLCRLESKIRRILPNLFGGSLLVVAKKIELESGS